MQRDINDDLLPRNLPKPPPLIEAVPKPSVPEVSLLFDQGKGNITLPQANLPIVKSSISDRSTVYDTHKSNTVFTQSLSTARSPEICNSKNIVKEEIPVINRQTESYNVWRSRNANLISVSKGRVGQGYESNVPVNYNYHNKTKDTTDVNIISAGTGQPRGIYSGHPSHRVEEMNGITPLHCSNRGHYEMYEPKELLSMSNSDYITQLNKYNTAPYQSSTYNNTHLPDHEQTSLYPAPEPYINTMKLIPANSLGNNKCDTKYYHSTSADTQCEDLAHKREPHNTTYRNATRVSPQDTYRYNKDHIFTQNQCRNGCHNCRHNVSQQNVCCNIPSECTSPNSCNNHRQELGHGCHRNVNSTHTCNSCPPIHNQLHTNDTHILLTDLCSTIKLQTEQILVLQKQIEQLLQLQINTHKYVTCSMSDTKPSENFPNGNSRASENDIRSKQANWTHSTHKTCENLPVIDENEQSTENTKVSVGVVTSLQDCTSTKDTSEDSHCNCSDKKKRMSEAVVQKPIQEKPAYYEELPQHDKEIQKKPIRPAHTKTTRKGHENKQKLKTVEESFTLNEADLAIDTIAEQAPSPASSIHIDMTEYKSNSSDTDSESDSSDDSSNEGKPAEPEIGWTFYNNVVGQVNKILKKKETPPVIDEDVKRATIDYLRHIGISFSDDMDNNMSKRVTFNAASSSDRDGPSDGSLHMNGLAMQHIREDQMMNGRPDKLQDFMMYNVASGNTNLSFATLRYLERHHLLKQGQYAHYESGGHDLRKKKSKKTKKKSYEQHQQYISAKRKSSKQSKPSSKILDVEALKQQPKLL